MVEPISKEQAIQDGLDCMELVKHPGWKVVESEALERINAGTRALINVLGSDTAKVMELQSQIKALEWLLKLPATLARQAQELGKEPSEETQQDS